MVSSPQQVSSLLDGMEASLAIGELDHKKVLDSVERVFALKAVTPCQLVESFQSNNN